ncbi:hypothetical protein ACQ4PT_013586 [Festuca glaucescens]
MAATAASPASPPSAAALAAALARRSSRLPPAGRFRKENGGMVVLGAAVSGPATATLSPPLPQVGQALELCSRAPPLPSVPAAALASAPSPAGELLPPIALHVNQESRKDWHKSRYMVIVTDGGEYYTCECGRYEHMGMICCHILKVMITQDVHKIQVRHIMKRWTVDARDVLPDHIKHYQKDMGPPEASTFRHSAMYITALEVMHVGDSNPDSFECVMSGLCELKAKAIPKVVPETKNIKWQMDYRRTVLVPNVRDIFGIAASGVVKVYFARIDREDLEKFVEGFGESAALEEVSSEITSITMGMYGDSDAASVIIGVAVDLPGSEYEDDADSQMAKRKRAD